MAPPDHVIVGRIRKAHGIRGAVIVEPITDAPAAVFAAGRRVLAGTPDGDLAADGATLTVSDVRPGTGGGFIARFEEIPDRTAAEAWRDRYLLLPMDELEAPGEGEVFLHELVGMRVEQEGGDPVGEILEVYELPQGLTLDVRWRGGSVMLPFREGFVVEVDRAGGRVVMRLPDGMLD